MLILGQKAYFLGPTIHNRTDTTCIYFQEIHISEFLLVEKFITLEIKRINTNIVLCQKVKHATAVIR
jgi:hypothetical protein